MEHLILDPVNGAVEFDEEEFAILNTRTLRRLQYIKQLEFIYLVFPGCNHTRFEHTIGVAHLLKRIGENQQLMDNYLLPKLWGDIKKYELFDKELTTPKKKEFIKKLLVLCGLVHDIGHGPFSHFSEFLFSIIGMPNPKVVIRNDSPGKDFDKSIKLHEWIMYEILTFRPEDKGAFRDFDIRLRKNFGLKVDDEQFFDDSTLKYWIRFLERRYNDIKDSLNDISERLKVKKDKFNMFCELVARGACGKIAGLDYFIYGVVDMDRLDYLRRDAFMSGVKYGEVEIDRLLGAAFIFDKQDVKKGNGKEDNKEIFIDYAKGIAALEHIYAGMDLLYFTTIYHPCSAIAKNMMLKYILEMDDFKGLKIKEFKECLLIANEKEKKEKWNSGHLWNIRLKLLIEIFSMEDLDFIDYFRNYNKETVNGTKPYIKRLLDRDLYKKIAVLHWNDLHPSKRTEIVKIVKSAEEKGYSNLWNKIKEYEDQLGKIIYDILKPLSESWKNKEDFETKEGKVVLINLPAYEEKPPDIEKAIVRRKNLYETYSYHKANEISPLLEISHKMSMRNQIVSIYLHPDPALMKEFNKKGKQKKIMNAICNLFGAVKLFER